MTANVEDEKYLARVYNKDECYEFVTKEFVEKHPTLLYLKVKIIENHTKPKVK